MAKLFRVKPFRGHASVQNLAFFYILASISFGSHKFCLLPIRLPKGGAKQNRWSDFSKPRKQHQLRLRLGLVNLVRHAQV